MLLYLQLTGLTVAEKALYLLKTDRFYFLDI
jgi:hypothetical protein